MSTTTVPHGLIKHAGSDNWRSALKTDDPANMEYINAALSRNLLVNPGFEVFQRGGMITADLAYAHDRWQLDLAGSSTCTITDETTTVDTGSGHALKAVYVHNTASIIDQKLEDYLQLRGRTVTFAIRARKGVASSVYPYVNDSGSKTYGSTSTTTGAYETLSATLAIGSSATSVRVGVELRITDTVYLDNATLHVGSSAVAYTPLTAADDLARCLRYYQTWGGADVFEFVAAGQCYSTTRAQCALPLQAPMGGAPTMTVSAAGDWALYAAGATGATCTAVTFGILTPRTVYVDGTVASGLVAGNATVLHANNTTNARISAAWNP